ncbi:MAG: hypothetical protein WBA13_11785 [Microcoleaceae cyanobacterium]
MIWNSPVNWGLGFILLFLHCLIGSMAALIARQKGYRYNRWLALGLIGGTPIFAIALWLKPQASTQ